MNPRNEPVAYGGAITGLVAAAIPLLRAFGMTLTEDQSSALMTFLAAAIVVVTLVVRSKVSPTHKVEEQRRQSVLNSM